MTVDQIYLKYFQENHFSEFHFHTKDYFYVKQLIAQLHELETIKIKSTDLFRDQSMETVLKNYIVSRHFHTAYMTK